MEFHNKLKYIRMYKKLTQRSVAECIEINVRQYQRYENGEQIPSITILSKLSNLFRVPAGYFLDYELQKEIIDSAANFSEYVKLLEKLYYSEQKLFTSNQNLFKEGKNEIKCRSK